MAKYVLRRIDGLAGPGALVGASGRQYDIDPQGIVVVEGELDRDAVLAVGKPPECNDQMAGQAGVWQLVTNEAVAPKLEPESPTVAVLELEPEPEPPAPQQDAEAIRTFGTTAERQEARGPEISVLAEEAEPAAEIVLDIDSEKLAYMERKADESDGVFAMEAEADTDADELDVIDPDLGYRRCRGQTLKGTQCKRRAQAGSNYCVLHDPEG